MTRNRITRRSLKRKIIGAASALFITVALIASGFSAWIISTNAKAEADIGVSVATVSKSIMTISVDGLDQNGKLDQVISFSPDKDDHSGRVRYSDIDGGGCESLTIVLTGTVSNAQHLGSLSVTLDYTNTRLELAADKGYITLPQIGNANGVLQLENLNQNKQEGEFITSLEGYSNGYIILPDKDEFGSPVIDEAGEQTYTAYFVYTVTFGWGDYFAGVNPGYYYDGVDKLGNPLSQDIIDKVKEKTGTDIENEIGAFNALLKEGGVGTPGNLKFTIDATIK